MSEKPRKRKATTKPAPKPTAKRVENADVEIVESDGLTIKQRLFVDHYIVCMNGAEAARQAGYSGDSAQLAVMASQNLRNPNITRTIDRRLSQFAMSANEVLIHLTDIARGDMADALNAQGGIDALEARARGKSHLIKRIRTRTITTDDQEIHETEVEMYDRLDALKTLAKFHSLLIDRTRVEDWRTDVIALIRDGKVTPEQVRDELGDELTQELFASVGLPVTTAGEG